MTPPPLIATPDADMTTNFSFHSSGVNVVSGVSGTDTATEYRGPWYIEEQTMNIRYFRVPAAHMHDFSCNLSSVAWNNGHVFRTSMACFVNANVVGTKDWGTYTASSWSQPQTFKVYAASADSSGQTYGDLTASSFGPAGEIITKQKYYSRVPWNDASGHSEFNHSCNGSNTFGTEIRGGDTSTFLNPEDYNIALYWAMSPQAIGSPLDWYKPNMTVGRYLGYMTGGYSPLAEHTDISTIVGELGRWVGASVLYAIPSNAGMGQGEDTGISTYQENRHDYSVSG